MTWILSLLFRVPYLTGNWQQLLDQYGWLYVQSWNYIPIHNYTRLWKYLIRDLQRDKPRMTSCKVQKSIINHKKETQAILTGADYYVQICTKIKDHSYLFKVTC